MFVSFCGLHLSRKGRGKPSGFPVETYGRATSVGIFGEGLATFYGGKFAVSHPCCYVKGCRNRKMKVALYVFVLGLLSLLSLLLLCVYYLFVSRGLLHVYSCCCLCMRASATTHKYGITHHRLQQRQQQQQQHGSAVSSLT